jgi:hypothetical protein
MTAEPHPSSSLARSPGEMPPQGSSNAKLKLPFVVAPPINSPRRVALLPTGPTDDCITFVISAVDDPSQTTKTLQRLRSTYPFAPVIIRCDGVTDPKVEEFARPLRCETEYCEHLGSGNRHGEMVAEFLRLGLRYGTPYILKIHSDTQVDRRFQSLPQVGCCVFGSVQGGRQLQQNSFQGSVIGLTRMAAEQLLKSGLLNPLDPHSNSQGSAASGLALQHEKAQELASFDQTLLWACGRLGIPLVNWPEIARDRRARAVLSPCHDPAYQDNQSTLQTNLRGCHAEAHTTGIKVFGIGLSRTGTTSLTAALRLLGYDVEHYFFDLARLDVLDGGTDTPIARCFQLLDYRYPGSKFILTVRDSNSWLASCARHFAVAVPPDTAVGRLRQDLYGRTDFAESEFREAYQTHFRRVTDYFANRPDDLLVLDICSGARWEDLCEFLRRPVPAIEFPHRNQGAVTSAPL